MMNRRFVQALVTVAALASFVPALAEGRIRGSAKDEQGAPVVGVAVKLLPTARNADLPAAEVKTNKKGEFLFGTIRPGEYRLAAFSEGLRIARMKASLKVPDNPVVWDYDGIVPSGTEMPPVSITGLTEGEIDLTFAKSTTGPGKYGTGEPISTVDSVIKLIQSGDPDRAVAEIERALTEKPDNAMYNYLYGYALLSAGKPDRAIAPIDKVLAVEPNFEGARLLKGKALEATGDNPAAIEEFRREAGTAPSPQVRVDAYLALGVALERTGSKAEAAAAFEKVVEIDPKRAEVLAELNQLYLELGDAEKAQSAMDRLQAAGGQQDPALLYNMGAAKFNAGEFQAAADYFRRAIAADPKMAEAYLRLGYTSLNLGDRAAALENLKKYLELRPDGPQAETAKGIVQALSAQK